MVLSAKFILYKLTAASFVGLIDFFSHHLALIIVEYAVIRNISQFTKPYVY